MIRLIFVVIFLLLYFILGLPVLGVLWLIGKRNKPAADIASLRIVQWAFKVILFLCGTKLTVIGEENVPKDQPVLYIANHQSYFDIVVSYSRCPGLTGYIAKDGLEKVPILSIWMKRLYCLFLNRQDIKEGMKTILKGIDQIKHGISMCIFPEGTRNKSEDPADLMEFHEGSLKIAEKSGCPVIPVAITGTDDVFERHIPWIRKSHVIIEYGEPIYLKELPLDKKKFPGAYTREIISEMIKKQQQERAGK